MERYRKEYWLLKRKRRGGVVWYYQLPGSSPKSTGCVVKKDADEWVRERVIPRHGRNMALWEYLEPFWKAETCPHVKRIRTEGKTISDEYIHHQRRRLEMYLKPDRIAARPVADIKHGELVDFRQRLVDKGVGRRTINKLIEALKTAVREGMIREELDRDFTVGLGALKYEKRHSDTFAAEELQSIFKENPGVWRDPVEYCAFLAAACTGARRGEILVMTWSQLDFDRRLIDINRALKSPVGEQIGPPKSGKSRSSFIPKKLADALIELRSSSEFVLPHHFVFGYGDGSLRQVTWWRTAFRNAMIKAGFFTKDDSRKIKNPRGLRPHSLRASANTLLLDAGGDPERIRQALGWQDKATQEIYTNAARLSLNDLRERMDQILDG